MRRSYLLGGKGHHWAHGRGRLQHVVSCEVLRSGTDGNLGLGDLQTNLRPFRHRLEADAPLDQRLTGAEEQRMNIGTSEEGVEKYAGSAQTIAHESYVALQKRLQQAY